MQSRADENLDHMFGALFEVIRSDRFLDGRGLGNELPYFISAYHPSLQTQMDTLVPQLAKRLTNHGIPVLWLNIYDLVVELLRSRGIWDRLLQRESQIAKDQFLTTLRNVSDVKEQIVPLVAAKLAAAQCRALLLDGVGLVFPFLRSHNVLENLQTVTRQTPTVLFFPGDYSGCNSRPSNPSRRRRKQPNQLHA